MTESAYRLGDPIDDYCPRCRLLLNHAVASMVGREVAKVICQTCYSEHPYRHGEGGKKKPASARATLFGQVLAKTGATAAPTDPPPADPVGEADQPTKKKRPAVLTRYIARHKTKPPRKGQ